MPNPKAGAIETIEERISMNREAFMASNVRPLDPGMMMVGNEQHLPHLWRLRSGQYEGIERGTSGLPDERNECLHFTPSVSDFRRSVTVATATPNKRAHTASCDAGAELRRKPVYIVP